MFKPKPRTLPQMLIRAVVQSIVATALFAASYAVANMGAVNMVMPEQDHPQVERPLAEKSPGWFVEKYDCWTGEAPADMQGKMPGHVIITEKNVTYRAGEKKVGEALSVIFEGKVTGIQEIHAFCR
jgi:hypothetical protein